MLLKHQFEAALLCVYGRTHIYTYVCKSSGNEWREEKNLRFIFQCDITMLYDKKKIGPVFPFQKQFTFTYGPWIRVYVCGECRFAGRV